MNNPMQLVSYDVFRVDLALTQHKYGPKFVKKKKIWHCCIDNIAGCT